ncbi:MAG TPA: XdhC family protein [Nevskia sp.]|nr:XdhC family protein [Nevskia sp.]
MNTPQEFEPLLQGFRRLEDQDFAGGAALATLTRTQGSTFRRAGARMLVCGDGSVVRGLSGGCPEADIIAHSHEVIAAGAARIVRYDRENGLDALIELGCGGELEVLIEPVSRADLGFVGAVQRCLSSRAPGFLATAFARDGRVLGPRPQRLVWSGETLHDEFGDAALREALIARAGAVNGRPQVQGFDTAQGTMEVLIETLLPPWAIVLVGVNAASLALARIGRSLGWEVSLVDHRDHAAAPSGLAEGARLVQAGPGQLAGRVSLDARSFAVVMTHNLERDIEYLRALLPAPLAYLGAIGSRQRAQKLLRGAGAAVPRVRAPAGLDLGSETPEEIALAIAAEILAVTTGRGAAPLSASTGPIH